MMPFRNLSIPKKIVALTMIISASALLVASGALVTYDYFRARRDLQVSTTTLARIVADNTSAAVSFDDRTAAADTLNALRAESSIVAACIYTADRLFAQRLSPGTPTCPEQPALGPEEGNYLLVSAPIELKGKEIGTVQLRATLEPAYARLRLEILSIAAILVLAALFALALSTRLHRLVSAPILSLSRTANEVSRRKDYSIRATKQSEDELGTLVDSFNEMLGQIQARQADLEDRTSALAEANEELQKANKMKDEFLATLSHELRTPLASIFGWVNLLQEGRLDQKKVKKALNVIDRNVRAQTQLVDDLLNVSQIITGKLKIRPEWIEAGPVVRAAVESIRPAATAKGIDVVMEIADVTELLFADPERLQQVLWNLLTNAVKFSDRGGEIKVVCRRIATKVHISVSDRGEGIDPEFLPFVFERFTQADASKTRKHGGLGLGLAIVRHIVESHGGTIAVHSQGKGHGTTFTVQLPVPAVRPSRAEQPAGKATSLRGLKVMVVEDEVDSREMVAEGLEEYGASVVLAASAPEALQMMSKHAPDVLVCDIGMPDMDGYQLIEKIRLEYPPEIQNIPAVALTAFASDDDKRRSLDMGYQAHLSKPIAIGELVRTIAAVAGHALRS